VHRFGSAAGRRGCPLFTKGASAASALAFQFASTNLVWELGVVLWVLIGWQFTLAEYVGGLVMIVLMAIMLRRPCSSTPCSACSGWSRRARGRPARTCSGPCRSTTSCS